MGQTRYFARAGQAASQALFDRLDHLFGEEGVPLAIIEIDEKTGLKEVSAYFEEPDLFGEAAILSAFAELTPEREDLPEIDWMASVLADLKPVHAGRFMIHGAHDRASVQPHDLAIEIEAGQAFGTGHHETTTGCLRLIGDIVRRRRPRTALDLGTGSAVLAIAIAKLARSPVLATDIDPIAVGVADANVRLNGVRRHVRTAVAAGLHSPAFRRAGRFDLIVANILAGPLMTLAPQMARRLSPAGDVILSGILNRQRRAVLAAYRIQGLFHARTLQIGDWSTLHLRRSE